MEASIATLPNINLIDEELQSENINVLYTYNRKYYIKQTKSPLCLVRFIRSFCVFFFSILSLLNIMTTMIVVPRYQMAYSNNEGKHKTLISVFSSRFIKYRT